MTRSVSQWGKESSPHQYLNELTIREFEKIEQYKIFKGTRTRCIVPLTKTPMQELGLNIVEASSHTPWERQDQMLTSTACLLISAASFFELHGFFQPRSSTSPMTGSCHFSEKFRETNARVSFWPWWLWSGGMSFKQKQRLVSPCQNWFLKTCSPCVGNQMMTKRDMLQSLSSSFGKTSKKAVTQLPQARERTAEQLFDQLGYVALAVEGNDDPSDPTARCINDTRRGNWWPDLDFQD